MLKSATAIAVLVTLATVAPAFARETMTATLEKAVEKPRNLVLDGVIWRCLGTACATTSDITAANPKGACTKLARSAGSVTAFTSPKGPLSAADLAACNG